MDSPPIAAPLDQIISMSGIEHPNVTPYSHITAISVVWQDQERISRLLDHIRPFFETIVVGVQESTDLTLNAASELADIVVTDTHRGFGDATLPAVLARVSTPWTLKLDADEWPDEELLRSLSSATWYAETAHYDGVWLPFRSWVDDIEYQEQHSHLRLFRTHLGWSPTLHSRPMTGGCVWHTGHIEHRRSLDEMMQDYLRYWRVGEGNRGWTDHNRLMMYHACRGTAEVKGWDYVKSFDWWPEVEAIAFAEERP